MPAPGTSIRLRRTQLGRGWPVALVSAALALAVLPAATTSAATPLVRFGMNYNDCRVYGAGPASTNIKITWRDSDGSLKHVQTVKSKANGQFQTACDGDEQVERGDVVTAKIGAKSRSFTVPRLNFAIDRVEDVIEGRAPDNAQLLIDLPGFAYQMDAMGDGTFAFDATANVDLVGSDWVTVTFQSTAGDVVRRQLQTPFVTVYRGRADVFMRGTPGTTMEVTLWDGGTIRASIKCTVGPTGGCSLQFTDEDGHMVRPVTGNTVEAYDVGSDGEFTIPAVAVSGAPATDVISGTCRTGQTDPYYFAAYRPVGNGSVSRSGSTNASGNFSRDVTANYDLKSGDKIYAECQMPTGDWVARFITVP